MVHTTDDEGDENEILEEVDSLEDESDLELGDENEEDIEFDSDEFEIESEVEEIEGQEDVLSTIVAPIKISKKLNALETIFTAEDFNKLKRLKQQQKSGIPNKKIKIQDSESESEEDSEDEKDEYLILIKEILSK